jgi:hypothetical protein
MNYYQYDSAVIVKIMDVIESQLTTHFGIDSSDLRVVRGNQPTQQHAGAVSSTKKYQIFISQIPSSETVGQGFGDKDLIGGSVERTYHHIRRRVIQLDCLADYDLEDVNSLEASDLSGILRDMMKQQDFIEDLTNLNINLISVSGVRPVFSINQSEQYESAPSFDVTFTYNAVYNKEILTISDITSTIKRV